MKHIIAALLLFAPAAFAQAVPGTANISWALPTTGCSIGVTPCDNVSLGGSSALTAIEVYVSTSPIADTSTMVPTLTLGPTATTATYTQQVTNGATLYVRIKAVNAIAKSPFSAQASKLVSIPVAPGLPTSVTITLQIG